MRSEARWQDGTGGLHRRRAVPAVAALAGCITGMLLARGMVDLPATVWFGASCGALAVAAAVRGRTCVALLLFAMIAFGGGWHTLRIVEQPRAHLDAILAGSDRATERTEAGEPLLEIRGVVLATPYRTPPVPGALGEYAVVRAGTAMPLRLTGIRTPEGWKKASGRLRIVLDEHAPDAAAAGDRIGLTGRFIPLRGPLNPGEPDRRPYASQRGEAGTMLVPTAHLITAQDDGSILDGIESSWLSARARIRDRAHDVLGGPGPDQDRGEGLALLRALILGDRGPELGDLRPAFARLGLAHLMAISGFHLAVMAGAALFAVRLTGERGRLEPLLVAGLVLVYLLIVPVRPPVARAGVMVLALLAARAMGRRHDPLAVVAWAALGLLLVRPADLGALGFQLSFGLTAALIWLAKPVEESLFMPPLRGVHAQAGDGAWWRSGWRAFRMLLVVCLICWAVAIPAVAHSAGIFSPLAIPATVVVLPLIMLLLWGGYALLLVGMLAPELGEHATVWLAALGDFTAMVVGLMDRMPGSSLRVPSVSVWWAAAATVAALVVLLPGRRRIGAWMCVAAGVWLAGELALSGRLDRDVALRIDALAVGDGSCVLLRSGGDAVLWDCGSAWAGVGRRRIPDALRELGVQRIERVFLSNPGFAHYSGLPDVIEPLGVQEVVLSRAFLRHASRHPWGAAGRMLRELDASDVRLTWASEGERFELGGASIRLLAPSGRRGDARSMVAMVTVKTEPGEARVLLTGGAREDGIDTLLNAGFDLRVDALELPARGRRMHETRELVEAADPAAVFKSCDRRRLDSGFWAPVRAGRAWWATARDGAVRLEITREGEVRSGGFRTGRER